MKLAFSRVFRLPQDIDPEVIDLCNAINALPGLTTLESCCGHGTEPFTVYATFDSPTATQAGLFFLAWCMDRRYWPFGHLWTLKLEVSDTPIDGVLPTRLLITSGSVRGPEAYAQANDLVLNMHHVLNIPAFINEFGLDLDEFAVRRVES
jgi:hypothetical protein